MCLPPTDLQLYSAHGPLWCTPQFGDRMSCSSRLQLRQRRRHDELLHRAAPVCRGGARRAVVLVNAWCRLVESSVLINLLGHRVGARHWRLEAPVVDQHGPIGSTGAAAARGLLRTPAVAARARSPLAPSAILPLLAKKTVIPATMLAIDDAPVASGVH